MNQQYKGTVFFLFSMGKNNYANAARCYLILTLLTYLAKFRKCSFTFQRMKLKSRNSYSFKNDQFKTKMDTNMSEKIFLVLIYDVRFKIVMRDMFREIQKISID
jgi:hypothetical protein